MALYTLFTGVKAIQTGPTSYPNQVVSPIGQNPNSPTQGQAFTLVINGIGNCSATAQIVGSNDGVNFLPVGAPIAATGPFADLKAGIQAANTNATFNFFGAYITAISGTNANATLTLSA